MYGKQSFVIKYIYKNYLDFSVPSTRTRKWYRNGIVQWRRSSALRSNRPFPGRTHPVDLRSPPFAPHRTASRLSGHRHGRRAVVVVGDAISRWQRRCRSSSTATDNVLGEFASHTAAHQSGVQRLDYVLELDASGDCVRR